MGSGIKNGTKLMRCINDRIHKTKNRDLKILYYQLALKSLAEFESFIDRQYRRKRLDFLHREMEKEIADNWDAVNWIYE